MNHDDASSGDARPRFGPILSARQNDVSPSDLEQQLRGHCQTMKIVAKLAAGAHIMFPSESSLAVRAYYPVDMEDLKNSKPPASPIAQSDSEADRVAAKDDFDGLYTFLKTYKIAVVLFVIPIKDQMRHLEDWHSFVNKSQRIVSAMTRDKSYSNEPAPKVVRVSIVPNTSSAISTLTIIADSLRKKEAKDRFFQMKRERNFLPNPFQNQIPQSYAPSAAEHASEALYAWADRMEIERTEMSILMNTMGTLGDIVSASEATLSETIPVEEKTQSMLLGFFQSVETRRSLPSNNLTQTFEDVMSFVEEEAHGPPVPFHTPPPSSNSYGLFRNGYPQPPPVAALNPYSTPRNRTPSHFQQPRSHQRQAPDAWQSYKNMPPVRRYM